MARIRTVKPEFFRHELLQDLEVAHPGKYPMMVFIGLWGHCDSKGRFEWRPRQLKLDILPFIPFDMAETLSILESVGMVKRYEVEGKTYGEISTFEKHQRLTGKEATEGEKHPEPTGETSGKQQGNTGERVVSQEGKGREKEGEKEKEREREGKGETRANARHAHRLPPDFPMPNEWADDAKAIKPDWSPSKTAQVFDAFRDYWTAKPGKDGTKLDWRATWRNWCRRESCTFRGGDPPKLFEQQRREAMDASFAEFVGETGVIEGEVQHG